MHLNKITSLENYHNHLIVNDKNIQLLRKIDSELNNRVKTNHQFNIQGYSWTAQSESSFLVDLLYSCENELNLRERLICKKTKLNNRIRGSIHIFEALFKPQKNDSIYLTEQFGLLAKWMASRYKNLTCSEYLEGISWYHKMRLVLRHFPKKVRHQDLTKLSFADESFNYVLSFDCFEHIPDYQRAFKEIARVLKPGGKVLFSVPFDLNSHNNLIRATIENGKIEHLTEPEYHGNPVSAEGCLSFYTFGWQLLDELKENGFENAYIILYWSKKYCYIGGEQILICAEKQT